MKRLPAAEDDKRSVGEWYARWDKFVADVCTFMLTAVGAPWICTHSHLSVTPGTPYTSHGKRTPKS